jgi:hypothetical protein
MSTISNLISEGALVLYHDYRNGTAYDLSGNSNHGTLTDTNFSRGLRFNGSSTVVEISDYDVAGNSYQDMSVMALVQAPPQTRGTIIGQYTTGSNQRSWLITTGNTDTTKLRVLTADSGAGTNTRNYESSITAFDGSFHTVGFTWDSGTLELYVDGVKDTSVNKIDDDAFSALNNAADSVMLGKRDATDYLDGFINAACNANSVLTEAEMLSLHVEIVALNWPTKTSHRLTVATVPTWYAGFGVNESSGNTTSG